MEDRCQKGFSEAVKAVEPDLCDDNETEKVGSYSDSLAQCSDAEIRAALKRAAKN